MDTKHLSDRIDPIAKQAKALSTWPAGKPDAPRQQESDRIRVVEDLDVTDERAVGVAAADAAASFAAELPAAERPVRSEFVLNPLSRRVVPYWRRRH